MLAVRRPGVGLALAICLTGSPALAGSPALGATSALAATSGLAASSAPGQGVAPAAKFHTWRGAQHAARFRLLHPRRTYKLRLAHGIQVEHCHVPGKARKRIVDATYSKPGHAMLAVEQSNSGGPCGRSEPAAKPLGTVKIHGVTAHLSGLCGMTGQPSCHSKKIFLFLTWRHHGVYYQAISYYEARATLIGFARSLTRVAY
jgi:hypothetical protein